MSAELRQAFMKRERDQSVLRLTREIPGLLEPGTQLADPQQAMVLHRLMLAGGKRSQLETLRFEDLTAESLCSWFQSKGTASPGEEIWAGVSRTAEVLWIRLPYDRFVVHAYSLLLADGDGVHFVKDNGAGMLLDWVKDEGAVEVFSWGTE